MKGFGRSSQAEAATNSVNGIDSIGYSVVSVVPDGANLVLTDIVLLKSYLSTALFGRTWRDKLTVAYSTAWAIAAEATRERMIDLNCILKVWFG